MEDNDFSASVGFLYRTMVERDPSKRRVKPVENHYQLLDFGDLDDSSDDSDFKVDHDAGTDNDDSGDSNKEDTDEGDDEEDEEEKKPLASLAEARKIKEEPESIVTPEGQDKIPKLSVGELIERAMQKQSQARQRISTDGSGKKWKVLICCVCLGDISEEDDEIVECDCCGVTVHEGCYGISDSDTAISTASSSSTEPWFCDACKSGNMNPICELCPNGGGIFKETDVGRWVHLVCALYIPGVAFGDVDRLNPVTLFEMPYTRWGAKACVLCEDDRFCRTGVCISCDAGMCRNFFHVTCAQREGLLSEASTQEDIADPFYAYCKLHADKMIVRSKRRNWLAMQSQSKGNRFKEMPESEEKARIERKLRWHRDRYVNQRSQQPPPWVPTQKMPRLLSSSPTASRRLLKKAELLGLSPQSHISSTETLMDIRKKWHVSAAFNIEFVSYYLDRNTRMITMQKHLDELLQQNSQLQEHEQKAREQYERLFSEMDELKTVGTALLEKGTEYWKMLAILGNKKLPLPEVLKPKCSPKSSGKSSKKHDGSTSVIFECGLCHKSHDQHQLAKCDKCQLHYHLACLDPPLTRMPKKTKSQGWQCSECDKTQDDRGEAAVDPDAPRRLRDHVKGMSPFFSETPKLSPRRARSSRRISELVMSNESSTEPESVDTSQADEQPREKITLTIRRGNRMSGRAASNMEQQQKFRRGRKRMLEDTSLSEKEGKPDADSSVRYPARKLRRDSTTDCCRCGSSGEVYNTVRCDQCKKFYHFQCLQPPVKKSPKQRGYTWHCEDCDTSIPSYLKPSYQAAA